jgi:thiosulfate/3-mercaptopyruvate sulfurtransferase
MEYYDVKYKFGDEVNSEIQASIQTVKSAIEKRSGILVDTRSREEFSGELQKKGAARAGAIPSSVNLDWSASVNYEGNHRFRSVREMEKIYGDIGITESTEVITYCHSGVRSAHTLFVLKELLGYGKVQNYDGSWTEWSHISYE